ncbi:hypothetical protein GCM10011529_22240 [Polymorphobacter glacialis]|uniref:Uncharacterized protein n=1 Tax=Sandarakinorhabdus glacialis TaxID=1614636 RepID=A0A916ZUY8_9SPHN|nr:hypothetical protein [Polymorphobacter glacialis]GGE15376.1 hypothetical protein GCM10011529_22240 [Polymorphobacter glacialis]
MRLIKLATPVLAVAVLAVAAPAAASSDAAWDKGMAQASKACIKVSNLRQAAIIGQPILFSDDSGKTALLVGGRWRPAHMKGARATMLCLYDRKMRTAETQEALKWGVAAK